jgi:hypothetical protein
MALYIRVVIVKVLYSNLLLKNPRKLAQALRYVHLSLCTWVNFMAVHVGFVVCPV